MSKYYTKPLLFLLIILFLLPVLLTFPSTDVFASSKGLEIKLFGSSSIEIQADSAEIYGSIECVDLDETQAKELVQDTISKLENIIAEYNNYTCEIVYECTYPLSPACYRTDAYIGYANYQIRVSDLAILPDLYSSLCELEYSQIDGIKYTTNNPAGYIDAVKSAIAKANSKIQSLYSSEATILEIEEIDCYNSHSTYIASHNIDTTIIPMVEIFAKVEITYIV